MLVAQAAGRGICRGRLLSLRAAEAALLLATALAAVALALKGAGLYRTLLAEAYVVVLAAIVLSDLRTLRVSNWLTLPPLLVAAAASFPLGDGAPAQALLGGLFAFVLLLVLALVGRGRMGYGDVKAGTFCGMVVGLTGVLPMLTLTFVAGGAVAAVVLALRLRGRKDVVAFTPFLAGATVVTLLCFPTYLLS